MRFHLLSSSLAATCLFAALSSPVVSAAVITDPAGDFVAGYLGPTGGDLDILSAEVILNGNFLRFQSTSNGNIGTTAGGFFVWGINRGAGTQGFPTLAPGVFFDSVVVIRPGGVSTVRDSISTITTNLDNSAITISGATISAIVSLNLLPSQGFTPSNYTVNLWPRLAGAITQIADFAPDNSNALVTTTPEPATFAMLGSALTGLALLLRRRAAR